MSAVAGLPIDKQCRVIKLRQRNADAGEYLYRRKSTSLHGSYVIANLCRTKHQCFDHSNTVTYEKLLLVTWVTFQVCSKRDSGNARQTSPKRIRSK